MKLVNVLKKNILNALIKMLSQSVTGNMCWDCLLEVWSYDGIKAFHVTKLFEVSHLGMHTWNKCSQFTFLIHFEGHCFCKTEITFSGYFLFVLIKCICYSIFKKRWMIGCFIIGLNGRFSKNSLLLGAKFCFYLNTLLNSQH